MKSLKDRIQKLPLLTDCFIGLVIGAGAFLCLYGISVLDPTNDNWILTGWAEWDIQQRYAGWINFRNSPWQFPLASAAKLGYPTPKGLNIVFTDSMPLISIFFKSISALLPATFQYEGIYSLCIFMLQGVSAMLLLRRFSLDRIYSSLGTVLFVFSPILLERNFRHTSLASHYLILFAMYLYFCYRKSGHYPWQMLILSAFSVGITPYFLPMVMIFVLLLAIENAISKKKWMTSLIFFAANIAIALITAVSLGAVGGGYASARDGYGFYSMNLNAFFNPVSCGFGNWSKVFAIRPQLYGQYDGFNYLGLGVLILFFWVLSVAGVLSLCRREGIEKFLARNLWLLGGSALLTAFAVSTVVCFDAKELMHIPLPSWLFNLCAIFRASSRLFYPVYYLIILSSIVGLHALVKWFTDKGGTNVVRFVSCCFLSLVVFVQLWDMSGLMKTVRETMRAKQNVDLEMPAALRQLDDYEVMFITQTALMRYAEIIAGKNDLYTNALDANTISEEHYLVSEYSAQMCAELQEGILRDNTVYVTINEEEYSAWQQMYQGRADFCVWNVNKPYVNVYPEAGVLHFMLPL